MDPCVGSGVGHFIHEGYAVDASTGYQQQPRPRRCMLQGNSRLSCRLAGWPVTAGTGRTAGRYRAMEGGLGADACPCSWHADSRAPRISVPRSTPQTIAPRPPLEAIARVSCSPYGLPFTLGLVSCQAKKAAFRSRSSFSSASRLPSSLCFSVFFCVLVVRLCRSFPLQLSPTTAALGRRA